MLVNIRSTVLGLVVVLMGAVCWAGPRFDEGHPLKEWVKHSPKAGAPVSPRLGYEGDCRWIPGIKRLLRYGGHNQGGGGEQGSEVWFYNPLDAKWSLRHTNISPPGVCCEQQNVVNPVTSEYIRFPSFSGSHGWQWFREIYLNDSTAWVFDPYKDKWRNMRPIPTPKVSPLRCASWDSEYEVVVMFGGEGNREGTRIYDPHGNEWWSMKPRAEPARRSGGNMAYDEVAKKHVMFGSQFSDDPHTWIYDVRKNLWRDAKPKIQPPTKKNDAVLTYDSVAKRVVAIVKTTSGSEDKTKHHLHTWSYDTKWNVWEKVGVKAEPDSSSNRSRQLTYSRVLNAVILENRTKRPAEQQVWTLRLARRGVEEVAPPSGVKLLTQGGVVRLNWNASKSKDIAYYTVHRVKGKKRWEGEFEDVGRVAVNKLVFVDKGAKKGEVYTYAISAGDRKGRVSKRSHLVSTRPRVVRGVSVVALKVDEILITWEKEKEAKDVVRYVVERAPVEVYTNDQLVKIRSQTGSLAEPSIGAVRRIGVFEPLAGKDINGESYVDRTVDLGKGQVEIEKTIYERRFHKSQMHHGGKGYRYGVYAYRVRAVNGMGVVSGPSAMRFTFPEGPEYLFSKESGGGVCELKWRKSKVKGIKGYRVYRMDGRFSRARIRRLTAEPIGETTYKDETAGKSTRRYYVVSVDGLGQEGAPSSPVWYLREWAKYYKPFIKDWHQ